jgi:hypothetical protein
MDHGHVGTTPPSRSKGCGDRRFTRATRLAEKADPLIAHYPSMHAGRHASPGPAHPLRVIHVLIPGQLLGISMPHQELFGLEVRPEDPQRGVNVKQLGLPASLADYVAGFAT